MELHDALQSSVWFLTSVYCLSTIVRFGSGGSPANEWGRINLYMYFIMTHSVDESAKGKGRLSLLGIIP